MNCESIHPKSANAPAYACVRHARVLCARARRARAYLCKIVLLVILILLNLSYFFTYTYASVRRIAHEGARVRHSAHGQVHARLAVSWLLDGCPVLACAVGGHLQDS